MKPFGIHWFRRDLRLHGNLPLLQNLERHNGRVLGVFFIDSAILSRLDFSTNRFAFFLKTLKELQLEIKSLGGELLVIDEKPHKAIAKILQYFKLQSQLPSQISIGRDYEPFAIKRDTEIKSLVEKSGVEFFTERDHLLFEPHEVVKDDGSFYQVYTPYSRKWFEKLHSAEARERLAGCDKKPAKFSLKWNEFKEFPYSESLAKIESQVKSTVRLPAAGHAAAINQLKKFKAKMASYAHDRDFPAVSGTSGFSIYLKNGSITPAQIIKGLGLGREPTQFLKEIIWREFYYSILFHKPEIETSAFNQKYRNINWEDDKKLFKKWCNGETGFPIVDAGMRQLNTTGWMHNRVRMIVASFLTKDLLINWQLGEKYFMEKLLDGDLAANNGGWQWAASTGCDPQPYFRIFNPWLQSKKFDPDGKYIKKYVPELKNVPPAALHLPDGERPGYPKPVVNHAVQYRKAIALFKTAK